MSIIAPKDFIAENAIAQIENKGVSERVQSFIDKYELKFLNSLFGVKMASDFYAAISTVPVPAGRWDDLYSNKILKSMLLDYVYFYYMTNSVTLTLGTGEANTKQENSIPASVRDKIYARWNEMVNNAREFDIDVLIYPEFYMVPRYRHNEIFHYKNSLV